MTEQTNNRNPEACSELRLPQGRGAGSSFVKTIVAGVALLALIVLCLPAGQAFSSSAPHVAGPDMPSMSGVALESSLRVIVRMHDDIVLRDFEVPSRQPSFVRAAARARLIDSLRARAQKSRLPLRALLEQHGARPYRDLWLINGFALEASPALIREISSLPSVASVTRDSVIEIPEVTTVQVASPPEANFELIGVPALWADGYFGQGVTVAIMDSGVDVDHPDLGPRWRGGANSWFDPNGEHPDLPFDGDGHGTQVAGVVLGGDHGGSVIGAAPAAQWIGVKIFDDADVASVSAIHAGFQWLLDPDGDPLTDDAADIVNGSWGFDAEPDICDQLSREFQADVQALKTAGIAVVFSAGNTGPSPSSSVAPANYPESFAVGSVGTFDTETEISDFSARGPSACDGTVYPEVVAPGEAPHRLESGFLVAGIKTSDLSAGGLAPNPYTYVAGTSFSAPHVSGLMALLFEAFPAATVGDVEQALLHSSADFGGDGPDHSYGFGLVDAVAAFDYLAGRPGLSVTDSVPLETDHQIAFGTLDVGTSAGASVRVRNSGQQNVLLGNVDQGLLAAPFSMTSDGCSNQTLLPGAGCVIQVVFAPEDAGNFSGSLDVLSNVPGAERVTVSLTGAAELTGTRAVSVTDSILPLDDGIVAFGQVAPGQSDSASIRVRNSGTLPLTLEPIDVSRVTAPFSVDSGDCDDLTLLVGQSCTIAVRFAPDAAGEFAGSLIILSNADDLSSVSVALTGTGNTPPTAPQLLTPAQGAIVGERVAFSWLPATDTDGDRLSQFLVYATQPDFASAITVQVDDVPATAAGAGGLLLGGLCGCLARRHRKLMLALLFCGLLLGMAACGGGGGNGLSSDTQTVTVHGLEPGTTYYWKMLAEDSRGAETETEVRSFVVN